MNYKKGTQTRGCMKSVMRYVSQPEKTFWDGQNLVSGIGCQPETAFDEFLSTKLLHHSHCIINSVNFETGKKLHMADEQIQALRARNDMRQHKKRTAKQMDEPNPFSGLVFCADCGKPMVLHRATTMKKLEYNFKCYTYGKKGKTACSAHHIRECNLTQIVLDDLRQVTHFARMKERQFAAYINQKNSAELRQEINRVLRELDTMKRRSAELAKLFKRLYEDNVLGRVTDEQYRMLAGDYTDEQRVLEEEIPKKEERLAQLKSREANVEAFVEKAKRFTTINELTPELLRLFIQRIEIGERDVKYSRNASRSIRIIYRDIGLVGSAMQPDEQQPKILPQLSEVIPFPA